MWGTYTPAVYPLVDHRFIPTHVGNIAPSAPDADSIPVHPHACGEHSPNSIQLCTPSGSSPRMWGTWDGQIPAHRLARFIPTHVGNINTVDIHTEANTVHPHACGEHVVDHNIEFNSGGSSPRMWGTWLGQPPFFACYRFIPTHVGNIARSPGNVLPRTVHPHACGEHP